jgi:L,D-peptidoglycan transpeptidase YkuD (ErfK/YbiS/YcfS/YnhG family)
MPVRAAIVALAAVSLLAACTSGGADGPSRPSLTAPSPATSVPSSTPIPTPPKTKPTPKLRAKPKPTPTSAAPRADRLPLGYATGSAHQALTVVASAQSDTQGTLQAWRKVGGGWQRVGPSIPAWLGSAGMTPHPSEQTSATPMGSYPLTHAFGHDTDPGTALKYVHTTAADWWISQPGPLYNTMQRCAANCAFVQGDPNEHLYYETPYYNYAVVIDYNDAPVRQGAGSAFFLHVAIGAPTAGCVSIDQGQLVRIMRWLDPSQHPRILIGTS